MGRPRKNNADNKLPPRVRRNKYSYVWKPAGTKQTVTLAPVSGTSISTLWRIYEENMLRQNNLMTVFKLWSMFLDSPVFTELAPRTQRDYRQQKKIIVCIRKNAGRFGKTRTYTDLHGQARSDEQNAG